MAFVCCYKSVKIMGMMDDDVKIESEIDWLVRITGMTKLEIKTLAYLGHTTQEIIELSKK